MLETTQPNTSDESLANGLNTSPISYNDAFENLRRNTDWWIVYCTFDLPNSVGTSLWIANKLGISVESATEALEGLVILGHLKRSDKGYEKLKFDLDIPHANQTKAKRVEDHALVSQQILNHLNESSRGALRFATFAANLEIIVEMYEKINQAINEADEKSKMLDKSKMDNIYSITFTATNTVNMNTKGTENA